MKKVFALNAKGLSQVADLGDESVTSDDEGVKVFQNPLRGSKVEAGKQGNKYFPVEKKLKCLKLTSYSGDHISSSWEGIVDCLL